MGYFQILKAAIKSDSVDGRNVANVDEGFKLAFQTLEVSFQNFSFNGAVFQLPCGAFRVRQGNTANI
jgi:hypothetical protein